MAVNKLLEKEIQEKADKIVWVRNLQTGRIARANPCLARMVAKGRDGLVAYNPTPEELIANGYDVPKTRKKPAAKKPEARPVGGPTTADAKPRRARKVGTGPVPDGTQTGSAGSVLHPDPMD